MSERIDHAAEAVRGLSILHGEGAPDELLVTETMAAAQVHATLALAEQQRIANLIALGQFRVAPEDIAHFRHLVAQPSGEFSLTVSPIIAEGLGLS